MPELQKEFDEDEQFQGKAIQREEMEYQRKTSENPNGKYR